MAVIISVIAVWMAWHAFAVGKAAPIIVPRSIALPSPVEWFGNMTLSFILNVVCIIGIAAMMLTMNRQLNVLKSISTFFVAYFLFITCSTPQVTGLFTGSTLLGVVVMLCAWIMTTIYNERRCDRRILLVFFLLGAGILTEYCFAFYVPLFLVGIAQMRVMRFKKIMAALFGLIGPAWIVWGTGVAPMPKMPEVYFTPPTVILSDPSLYPVLATVAWTLVSGFIMGSINIFRFLGFNARHRAYNWLLLLLASATGIFAIVNFTNVAFYVVLLNALVAFQMGHFFRFMASRRGYIYVLLNMGVYVALYVWNLSL